MRVKRLLERLTGVSSEQLRSLRSVEVLEYLRTPEAKRLLRWLASGAPGGLVREDAAAALRRLERPRQVSPGGGATPVTRVKSCDPGL